jgi:hypothetical protein
MDALVQQRLDSVQPLLAELTRLFQQQLEKIGFEPAQVTLHSPEQASYKLQTDPSNGEQALVGDWLDERGFKKGSLIFHADGSFYVEQDVAHAHPLRKSWFVEALNAWGKADQIKVEARLLPMPE